MWLIWCASLLVLFHMGETTYYYPRPNQTPAPASNHVVSLTMYQARITVMNNKYTLRETNTTTEPSTPITFASTAASTCPRGARIFRTADGFCNNILRPIQGQSNQRFKRFVRPAYFSGGCTPRIAAKCVRNYYSRRCTRRFLPNARRVSTILHKPKNVNSRNTVMLMQWGQFLDHDITAAAINQPENPSACCSNFRARRGLMHPDVYRCSGQCFPIAIDQSPRPDRFFTTRCMEFTRSIAINQDTISVRDPREQQNLLTAFVDASNVYGSDIEQQTRLRAPNGRMATSANNLLPRGRDEDCIRDNSPFCFDAGDERVHVFPGLTALHTALVRYHNNIVQQLDDGTNWSGSRLFEETRRIIGALIQRITYTEYLPEVLNSDTIRDFNLAEGNYVYNISIDPSIANSFATAAFRYGHSLIPDFLVIDGKKVLSRALFNNPQFIFSSLNSVVENILSNPGELRDRFLTAEITDHLFETEVGSLDLAALNIQRGRDHGLPPYNVFRQFCGLPRVTSFYSATLGRVNGLLLHKVYNSVDDIDLFSGGMLEPSLRGTNLGETFSCLLASQFRDLKFGDSFWYETSDSSRGFTPAQLSALQNVNLSQILCEVFGLKQVQRNPFNVVTNSNPKVNCDTFQPLDLAPWISTA